MDPLSCVKEKRKMLTIQQKIDILEKLEQGRKNRELCKEYGLCSSTISTILRNKDKIFQYFNELQNTHGNARKKKIITAPDLEILDKIVYAWYCEKLTIGEPISGVLLREKALFFYQQLKDNGKIVEGSLEFKASNGWLRNFKDRHEFRILQLKGEKPSAKHEGSDSFITFFKEFLQDNEYEYENVYNAQETGLQYRSLPNRTFVSANEEEVAEHKPLTDRLTVMLCANAIGSHKIPPLIIGTSKKPRCLEKEKTLHVDYIDQENAWMTTDIFLYWFREIFLKNVRKLKPHARIVLLLDNAPAHSPTEPLNSIDHKCEIIYLSPNVSSLIQPMNQGVISAVKLHYKTGFLRELLAGQHDNKASVIKFVKKFSVLEYIGILRNAWSSITTSVLSNSWKKLIPSLVSSTSVIPSNEELLRLVNQVPGGNSLSANEVSDWLSQERNLPVFEGSSDQQLLHLYASIQLPVSDIEESLDSNVEEAEELEESADESVCLSTPDVILKETQSIINWTRRTMHLTDEENLALIKVRDQALDMVLAGKVIKEEVE
ncbi:jerky protein homolog-like [Belonocnema kinseyi]|uniref:jerky protein homolog-like n=1 Tax=Belonocnema kinseyi TaxID=2817044 RepID=UPI00143CF52A|nr:jerky protein homolog-like [Belonocnema kinseyi]